MDKPIKLLVFGRNKSGKSTFVESLLGRGQNTNEYPNGDVNVYKGTRGNQMLQIFDVPSLDNIYLDERDIFTEVVKKTEGKAHLLLFCIDMRRRLHQQDRICLGHIDRAYGRSVWKNTMIILTFGNEVGSVEDFLKGHTAIRTSFAGCSLPETSAIPCWPSSNILSKVPVIPVGRRSTLLPDGSDWEKNFWDSAERIIAERPATLKKSNKLLWFTIISLCATGILGLLAIIVIPTTLTIVLSGTSQNSTYLNMTDMFIDNIYNSHPLFNCCTY